MNGGYDTKMIVVEGCDGAGKTALINKLVKEFGLPIHERSANSDGSATQSTEDSRGANLAQWAYADVTTQVDQPMALYDRHCLISEFVYGPILRGHIDPNMLSSTTKLLVSMLARNCLVIFCRPPVESIVDNVMSTHQPIDGLTSDTARQLAAGYDAMRLLWPGNCMGYDYTKDPDQLQNVIVACRLQIARHHAIQQRKYS